MALTETIHDGGFIVSEAEGTLSRDAITVLSGQAAMVPGTVVGKILTGAATAVAGTNTGNGTMGAITVGAGAIAGVYTLKVTKAATDAGDFEVIDPQGDVAGIGTVGVAYSTGGLSFTLADGATDFAVGDTFAITVAAGSGKWVALDTTATTGGQIAAGVLYGYVDASAADAKGVAMTRSCELTAGEITWPAGISAGNKATAIAQLAAQQVILR